MLLIVPLLYQAQALFSAVRQVAHKV